MEDRRGQGKVMGEIMLAVWMGTQADEAFPEAWHTETAFVQGEGGRAPELLVKVQVGNQVLRTKISPPNTMNPLWNEDLIFVVAEPLKSS
ncbi:FT-interacting protein 1 [Bienertia sinuspersici]